MAQARVFGQASSTVGIARALDWARPRLWAWAWALGWSNCLRFYTSTYFGFRKRVTDQGVDKKPTFKNAIVRHKLSTYLSFAVPLFEVYNTVSPNSPTSFFLPFSWDSCSLSPSLSLLQFFRDPGISQTCLEMENFLEAWLLGSGSSFSFYFFLSCSFIFFARNASFLRTRSEYY